MSEKKLFTASIDTKYFELLYSAQEKHRKATGKRLSLAELVRRAIDQVYGVPRA